MSGWRETEIAWRDPKYTFDPDRSYTPRELENLAEAILIRDFRTNLCPDCEKPEVDPCSFGLASCPNGHFWRRSITHQRGRLEDSPILDYSKLNHRRRKEIVNAAGVPEPNMVSGLFSRTNSPHGSANHVDDAGQSRVVYKSRPFSEPVKHRCWPWAGPKQRDRQGVVSVGGRAGKKIRAHRLSYFLYKNDPGSKVVQQTCGNVGCVNPAHLALTEGNGGDSLAWLARESRDYLIGIFEERIER